MIDEKPTVEMIQELLQLREDEWQAAHSQFEVMDGFYWGTFPVWDAKHRDRPVRRPSTGANLIDHAVDNQLALKPKITVIPSSESESEKSRTGSCERFLGVVWEDSSLLEPTLPWKLMQRYGCTYGYMVAFGPRLDLASKPQEPVKRAREKSADYKERMALYEAQLHDWNPFRISAPHPARVLLDPLEKQPTMGLRKVSYYASELEKLSQRKLKLGRTSFPWFGKRGAKPFEKIEALEFFSDGWHALMTKNGELIFVEPNTWGFCPFLHAFAGWGMERTSSDSALAENLAIGVLHHVQDSLKAQAQEFSSEHNLLMKMAWTPMGTRKGAEEAAQRLSRGAMLEGEKADYWILEQQQIMPWMFQKGEKTERDIEAGTYAKAIRGVRETGVTTVGQQAILTNAAQRKFEAFQEQLNQVASIVASRILRLVEVYGEAITVGGQTLKPGDVNHKYAVRVRFELVDPIMKMQQDQKNMAEYDRRLRSRESYWEATGQEDSSRERDRLMEDDMWKHPALIEMGVSKQAEKQGLDKIIKQWEQQQAEAQGGLVGPGETPLRPAPRELGLRQPLAESVVKPAPLNLAALGEEV